MLNVSPHDYNAAGNRIMSVKFMKCSMFPLMTYNVSKVHEMLNVFPHDFNAAGNKIMSVKFMKC